MRSWDAGNRSEFLGTQPRIGSDHGKLAQSLAEWIRPRAVFVRAGPAPRSPPIRRPPTGPRGDHVTPTVDVRARLARRSLLCPRFLRLARRWVANRGRSRGVLRPLLLRGRRAPRRTGGLPVVPQLVRRRAARRHATRIARGGGRGTRGTHSPRSARDGVPPLPPSDIHDRRLMTDENISPQRHREGGEFQTFHGLASDRVPFLLSRCPRCLCGQSSDFFTLSWSKP